MITAKISFKDLFKICIGDDLSPIHTGSALVLADLAVEKVLI